MSQPRECYVRKCNASTSLISDNVVGNKVKKEAIKMEIPLTEQPQGVQHLISSQQKEEDEFWPLSGKPHFDIMPSRMENELPLATVPVVVTYCGKKWEMVYIYSKVMKRLHRSGWKVFADDNHLKIGDACVFELVECRNDSIEFKVQILRGDFPAELLEQVEGLTNESPLNLD